MALTNHRSHDDLDPLEPYKPYEPTLDEGDGHV